MKARDYSTSNDKDIFNNSEKLFPLPKIKKIFTAKTRKFTKKDAISTFKNELKASYLSGNDVWFPLVDKYSFVIYREVFMRNAYWSFHEIYDERSRLIYNSKKRVTVWEREDTMTGLFELIKKMMKSKDLDKIKKMLDDYTVEYGKQDI